MNVKITNHAIIRRYERYHGHLDIFDRPALIQEILNDFETSKLSTKKKHGYVYYQSKNSTFVVSITDDADILIITVYPNNNVPKTRYIKDNINIRDTNKYLKDIKNIKSSIANDDLLIIKHMGSKKILWLDESIVLARIESILNKLKITVLNKWHEKDFKDLDFLSNFKEKYFKNETEAEWIKFLQIMNIYDYAYTIKNKDYSKEVKIYQDILEGRLDRFPRDFWQKDIGGGTAIISKEIVKYLIEDYLGWSKIDLYNKFTKSIFVKYKLSGMLSSVFNNKDYNALFNAYPDLLVWKFKKYKHIKYWDIDNNGIEHAKKAIKWVGNELFDNYKGYNKNSILSINWLLILKRYNLHYIINKTFDEDYKQFFKVIFNLDCTDLEVERYYRTIYYKESQLRNNSIKVHI